MTDFSTFSDRFVYLFCPSDRMFLKFVGFLNNLFSADFYFCEVCGKLRNFRTACPVTG